MFKTFAAGSSKPGLILFQYTSDLSFLYAYVKAEVCV